MIGYTLGIDVGTSGAKAALLDLDALRLASVTMQGYDNGALQPSEMIWQATAAIVRQAVAGIDPKAVRGISFSAQMHGTVMYDAQGSVIEPIINWQDKRCDIPLARYDNRTTVEKIIDLLAGHDFDDLGIHVLPSGYLGATLFYLKENDPALFERIHHVELPGDFIRGKLLGASDRATDPTNAFGTGLFNTRLNCWHEGIIAKLGLPIDLLPVVHDSAEVAGVLPPGVAAELNLAPGTPVVYGGGDNQMSLLGNGLVSADSPALLNIGTGAQISQVTLEYARVPGIDTRSYFNRAYAFVGASLGGGRSYEELRSALSRREGREVSYREMDELAAGAPVGAEGLAYRLASRGAVGSRDEFVGRTELQDIGHQARAVLEGVLLDLYRVRPPTLREGPGFMVGAGKGLQKGQVWAQMAADLLDLPLKITNFENAVWGAAVMAAVGAGAISDLRDATATIEYSREFSPNPIAAAQYKYLTSAAHHR
ncbi:MAG: xylulokinase [Nitrososphaerales archaeon]